MTTILDCQYFEQATEKLEFKAQTTSLPRTTSEQVTKQIVKYRLVLYPMPNP